MSENQYLPLDSLKSVEEIIKKTGKGSRIMFQYFNKQYQSDL